ncbi:hypothetical protein P3T76_003765 [Phytophthora citrophthora]|uniref:PiggyBac transposable element-derived protein domain-containing protein n=1 Tax=Phytophthora citrophthora TaxID=4793 RepID=A0AAD9LS63_9STRA|nr:hypothetical protein P3T76_003765 [Phytophthora citrophthora]
MEIYSGKNDQTNTGGQEPADDNTGPAATLRNLSAVLSRKQDALLLIGSTRRSTSLYSYSSETSTLSELSRQTRKPPPPPPPPPPPSPPLPQLKQERSKWLKDVARGTTKFVVSKSVPQLSSQVWLDDTIVYMLGCGASTAMSTCGKYHCKRPFHEIKVKLRQCPAHQRYNRWMEKGGGRARSTQAPALSLRFRKYYKSLALDLTDMAIVNCFIVFRESAKMQGESPPDHTSFISQLHAHLLGVGAAEFAANTYRKSVNYMMYSPGPITPARSNFDSVGRIHKLEMDDEWVEVNKIRKRRQRQWKVCTIRKTVCTKRQMTRFCCPRCSVGEKHVYLCDKVRQDHYPGKNLTCYEIWHKLEERH